MAGNVVASVKRRKDLSRYYLNGDTLTVIQFTAMNNVNVTLRFRSLSVVVVEKFDYFHGKFVKVYLFYIEKPCTFSTGRDPFINRPRNPRNIIIFER